MGVDGEAEEKRERLLAGRVGEMVIERFVAAPVLRGEEDLLLDLLLLAAPVARDKRKRVGVLLHSRRNKASAKRDRPLFL